MKIGVGKIRGITAAVATQLKGRGIYYSDQLLEAARTAAGRDDLAGELGVEPRVVLELANRADLARVRGIAGVFSNLLEEAGVDTVKELAMRNPENLQAKLAEINAGARIAGRDPALGEVQKWVAQAKALPRGLEY